MSTELVHTNGANLPPLPQSNEMSLAETQTLGAILAQSGYFKDASDASKAIVKVLAGREVGIPPIASMKGIHIVEGKPSFAATTMAALVKKSRVYDYRIRRRDAVGCSIEFFQGTESLGLSTYTWEMAQRAGLASRQVWKAYPENMLFARAMSAGVNMYCPDLFLGPVYTPEELGADVNPETGEVAPSTPISTTPAVPVDVTTGEIVDPPTPPATTPELTPNQRKRQAFEALLQAPGWNSLCPNSEDFTDVKAALANLLNDEGLTLKATTAEQLEEARRELEARNQGRKRYFGIVGDQGQERRRADIARILKTEPRPSSWLSSTEWQTVIDAIQAEAVAAGMVGHVEAEDADPFDD